jgi:hypothetical protein
MTIHCLYSAESNALLGVSENELVPAVGQAVTVLDRGMPDFSLEAWNPAMLNFYSNAAVMITHLEFRRRFTADEQELVDEFNATFETNGLLTVAQKRKVRTGLKNFEAASGVVLSDPDIPAMLAMYEALGILASGRAAEILA